MHDDARRWDERYSTMTRIDPDPPEMLEHWPQLTSLVPTTGRCTDVACGPGPVTLWLADRNLEVTALDASAVAIDLLQTAATAAGCADRVDARIIDLDDGLPDDLQDLDLIVCQRFRNPALYPAFIDRLRGGGVAMITVLSTVGVSDPGPFHAPPGELRVAFTNRRCEILHHSEDAGTAHVVIRRH
jgi:SAM-dependent methyltransferase